MEEDGHRSDGSGRSFDTNVTRHDNNQAQSKGRSRPRALYIVGPQDLTPERERNSLADSLGGCAWL